MVRQEHKVEWRLVAIFAADVAGYSRLMSQDDVGTLHALSGHRDIMDCLIAEHGSGIANTAGDSGLAEFPSAVDAVRCAVAIQNTLASVNAGTSNEERLQLRIVRESLPARGLKGSLAHQSRPSVYRDRVLAGPA
jgi:adenylate cyclase